MPDVSSDLQLEAEALLGSVEEVLEGAAWDIEAETNALLESVQGIVEEDKQCTAERRRRGEDFNVFELLGIEHYEDRLHSRFLAELLDPQGSHGQRDAFLRLFLEQVKMQHWLLPRKATVQREKSVGQVDVQSDDPSGGSIDIFITDGKHHLSIENKIWSGQGREQITRYCNYEPEKNHVLFLTLRGQKADTKKKNCDSISYGDHILPWLDECHEHTANSPRLQGIIQQYTVTVRRLTGRLTMNKSQDLLLAAMRRHPTAALVIYQNFDALLQTFVTDLVVAVRDEVARRTAWRPKPIDNLHVQYGGLEFMAPDCDEVRVKWESGSRITKASYCGIVVPKGTEQRTRIEAALNEKPDYQGKRSDAWPTYKVLQEAAFAAPGPQENLLDEAKRTELAHQIAEKLIGLIQFCDSVLGAGGDAA